MKKPLTPKICDFCKHVYGKPCDGKDKTCENRKFIESQKKGKK